ncbi:MAG: ATP-binding cassette domain-containing protein [Chlamydiales bacterium]|nr:ATP-binding cassette domain-containing protein [Chlamydiales bacterium]
MLAVQNLSLRFGDKWLFKDLSVQFLSHNRYGLIGANGCGKTSFLKILASSLMPTVGDVLIPNKSKVGTLEQDHFLYDKESILNTVLMGNHALWDALVRKEELLQCKEFAEKESLLLSKLEDTIEKEGGYIAQSVAAKLLEGLGLPENQHLHPLHTLSGGYKLRVLLAKVLFSKPEILLLDEPTNHLDLFSIKWLEGYLQIYEGVLIVSSHDKDFLNSVCTHIADVDYGTIRIYKGNFDSCVEKKKEEETQKLAQSTTYEKKREKLQGFVDRFGAKASKAIQAGVREKMIEKLDLDAEKNKLLPSSRAYPKIVFNICRNSGQIPLKIQNVCKSFGKKQVLHEISFEVEREERIAIIGPNGIGKSTLLEVITGNLPMDSGTFNWGFETHFSYFPQSHPKDMEKHLTPLEWLSLFDREVRQETLRSLLGQVLFKRDDVFKKIECLSGGEVSRLVIARMMLQKHNVLILDEPTNHLDMESIDVLTEALLNYKGTLIFVSHNCFFVSKIATRIIEITPSGVRDFKGSYDEYVSATERDYLSSNIPLRLRFSKQFHHGDEIITTKKESDVGFQEKKRSQSQLRKEREHVKKLEDACTALEMEIKKCDEQMASLEFYQSLSREDQNRVLLCKQEAESKLALLMQEWEERSIALESGT